MNKYPFLKLQSSKSIEELLSDTGSSHSQNWLLSYLDVFVLIVMLVITLISLGELKLEEENRKKTLTKAATVRPVRPPVQKPRRHPAPEPAATERIPAKVHPDEPEMSEPMPSHQPPPPASNNREVLKNNLSEQLGRLGLGQKVAIKVTEDYAQLEIQDKILFESSQASLTDSGETLLKDLADVLEQASGLIFIEGHTDNRPIKTPQFPSNWELGSARATSVLHYLSTQGLDSGRMRAVTYADTMPIADNSTPEGREKNRRVSILIKVQEQDITP